MSQAIGALVEFVVGDGLPFVVDRRGCGGARRLRLKQMVETGRLQRCIWVPIPLDQHLLLLGGG